MNSALSFDEVKTKTYQIFAFLTQKSNLATSKTSKYQISARKSNWKSTSEKCNDVTDHAFLFSFSIRFKFIQIRDHVTDTLTCYIIELLHFKFIEIRVHVTVNLSFSFIASLRYIQIYILSIINKLMRFNFQ